MRTKLQLIIGTKIAYWTIISEPKRYDYLPSGKTGKVYYDIQCKCGLIRKGPCNELYRLMDDGIGSKHQLTSGCRQCMANDRRALRTDDINLGQVFLQIKQGAKVRNHSFELELEETISLFKMNCHYCNITPSNISKKKGNTVIYSGLDRIDSKLGYEIGNVVSCCKRCNIAKNDQSLDDYYEWLNRSYNYNVRRLEQVLVAPSGAKQEAS